ncbi:hypothetical protein [Nisaea sp.]|uniref:hypothetical protein n=1 Tax=Nisaea sp. TaxID=2024842 RepID=UPI003296ECD4
MIEGDRRIMSQVKGSTTLCDFSASVPLAQPAGLASISRSLKPSSGTKEITLLFEKSPRTSYISNHTPKYIRHKNTND